MGSGRRSGWGLWLVLALCGCGRLETIKLALPADPDTKGLFIVASEPSGGVQVVAIDPASDEGLDLLVRRDPDDSTTWTAVLLPRPLSALSIRPGPIKIGTGNAYTRRDYRIAEAVASSGLRAFQPRDGDPLIAGLGLPFSLVRSPSFPPSCGGFGVRTLRRAGPEIVATVYVGSDAVLLLSQSLYRRGAHGLEPRPEPLAPPVVSLLSPATGAELPYVSDHGPDTVQGAFVTAMVRSYAGRYFYAAVTRTPALKTEIWIGDGIAGPFTLATTYAGVEVRRLTVERGCPTRLDAMTDRGAVLSFDEASGDQGTLATATSTGGACRFPDQRASPTVDCGHLEFDSTTSDLLWAPPSGDQPLGYIPRLGAPRSIPLPSPEDRVIRILGNARLVLSSPSASGLYTIAGSALSPSWKGAPVVDFLPVNNPRGDRAWLALNRQGDLFEVRADGSSCAPILPATGAERLFSIADGVTLAAGPEFVDGDASLPDEQRLLLIRAE
ncbi:MAG: hypothetical protein U1E65_04085 [Myxococcota bacterium]